MGRRGRSLYKRCNKKRRIRNRDNSSDDSDEEYVLGEDESDDSRDSPDSSSCSCSCSSSSSSSLSSSSSSSANFSEESFDFRETSSDGSDEEQKVFPSKPRKRISARKRSGVKRSRRRARVFDDVDEDDEEFNPDVDDGVDDDEELVTVRKNRFRSVVPMKNRSVKSQKRKQKPKVLKKSASKRRGRLVLRRSVSSESDDDFVVEDEVEREEKKKGKNKKVKRRKKRSIMHSESDFVDSDSSDFDCTVSEEERDPLIELRICRRRSLTTCSRSLSLSKRMQVEGGSKVPQRRTLERKGKEKVHDLNVDPEKQSCRICLSEERKGIVRGILNCCAHYFCFTCIVEWSKVESRCPVCKQRFTTISKPARLGVGVGVWISVRKIPERDQVYQPSEEELRAYLEPYENLICMECQQDGDDDLMLICGSCVSPAHIYCVALEGEIPEGNWYCEDCTLICLGMPTSW